MAQEKNPANNSFSPAPGITKQESKEAAIAPAPVIPELTVEDATLREVIELLQEHESGFIHLPNFIFMKDVGDVPMVSLSLRNVSLDSILQILESVAGVEFETISDGTGTNNLIVRKRDPSSDPFAAAPIPTQEKPNTQVYMFPIDGIGVDPKTFEEQVRALWDISFPDWQEQSPTPRLLYHEGTEVFIVKANEDLGSLVDSFIGTIRDRQKEQDKDILRMREKQVAELQSLLNDKERSEAVLQQERQVLSDKIQELEFKLKMHEAQEKAAPTPKADE